MGPQAAPQLPSAQRGIFLPTDSRSLVPLLFLLFLPPVPMIRQESGNFACAWPLPGYRDSGFSRCECAMFPSAGQLGMDHGARKLQPAQPKALAELSEAAEGG